LGDATKTADAAIQNRFSVDRRVAASFRARRPDVPSFLVVLAGWSLKAEQSAIYRMEQQNHGDP
jgi:hypothetical protein